MSTGIAVIIPAYNAGKFIDETMLSIFNQTVKPDEIIIVDDGSEDDTVARAESYGSAVKVVRLKRNSRGCGAPRNAGIEVCKAELIVPFDADDLMLPRKLERHLQAARSDPQAQLYFHDFFCFGAPGVSVPHGSFCTINAHFKRFLKRITDTIFHLEAQDAFHSLLHEHYIGAGAIAFKRSAWRNIGGYDPAMLSAEDRDFCLRIAERFPFCFIDEDLQRYRLHLKSKSANRIENYTFVEIILSRYLSHDLPAETRKALLKLLSEVEIELVWQCAEHRSRAEAYKHWRKACKYGGPSLRLLKHSRKLAQHFLISSLRSRSA